MKVNISQEGKRPSPMIGLSIEDINYALDGGLNAEALENWNFESKKISFEHGRFITEEDGLYAWSAYPSTGRVSMKLRLDRPLYAENPHYLRLSVSQGGCGVKNKAYNGIFLPLKTKFEISFYARSYDFKGKICAGVRSEGFKPLEKKVRVKPDGKWHRYVFKLKTKLSIEGGEFFLFLSAPGTVHIDFVSLIPENAIKGVFRRDLAEYLKDFKPAFLKFPGSSVVKGGSYENRYSWKDSLGQRERRKFNWNCKAVELNEKRHELNHYGQTLGVGFYEYFLLCEYLGCKPLPEVGTGIICEEYGGERISITSQRFEPFIQDVLDLVEFAVGDVDSEWGSLRAELGHSEPFPLEFLLLDCGGEAARFSLFEKRIHEKYPQLKLILKGGIGAEEMEPQGVYCWEESLILSPEELYRRAEGCDQETLHADFSKSERKIYLGDFSAHSVQKGALQASDFNSALSEAAFMTYLEQNCEEYVMSSYMTLFGRIGCLQSGPILIQFDGGHSFATPNYHIQKMFSVFTGSRVLTTRLEGEGKLFASASEREGMTYLKLMNAGQEEVFAEIEGDFDFGKMTRILRLESPLEGENSLSTPDEIVPFEVAPTSAHTLTLPPRSFSLILFRKDHEIKKT